MRKIFFLSVLIIHVSVFAQESKQDTTARVLQPVIIQAYNSGRPLNEIPASVGYVDTENLNRFSNTNILPAVNAIPGVRMEERSPGSYRFSIRGSLLRSPFGVRNVKVYWNGLPLTDGGGNTYLNLLDFNSIGNLEIIKGPGGSLYGAGTGGVLLLNSPTINQAHWQFSAVAGSYGLTRYALSQQFKTRKFNLRIQYAHQHSDGYREQTEMSRQNVSADATIRIGAKDILSATFFYSDLNYQTPGALTKTQYDEDPRQARPAAGTFRGAVEQKAAVYNKTPYLGISYDHEWGARLSTRVGVFGSKSGFENPTIRNYEDRDETNVGSRITTQYLFGSTLKNKVTIGHEYQIFKSPLLVYDNDYGKKGAIQTDDDLSSRLGLLFGQIEFEFPHRYYLTAGGSVNYLKFNFTRNETASVTTQEKNFNAVFLPRVALLKKVGENISLFTSVSQGFSPPSLAEVRPSTNNFNNELQAEKGTNVELGFRGNLAKNKLSFDVAVYDFRLTETIVLQRDAAGADFFINAGETSQRGLEVTASWQPIKSSKKFMSDLKLWTSYVYNKYRFTDYVQDANDYSGNKLTGVPPTVNTSGLDITVKKKFYINLTSNYVDHVPLNDANSVYASEYFLLGGRIGFNQILARKNEIEIFAGIDNALDKKYSLGNDLNAPLPAGRYYNAAAPRNYYVGLRFRLVQ